ncbi:PRC-barrel domain-containing protein [Halodurantibacterium flavum]|uniref:PRC-barrel domain-containing protein n=1 Tax=Halodurantibacterium flavum TaxID=1382802 RepID=A0ABW4S443_9RHOB
MKRIFMTTTAAILLAAPLAAQETGTEPAPGTGMEPAQTEPAPGLGTDGLGTDAPGTDGLGTDGLGTTTGTGDAPGTGPVTDQLGDPAAPGTEPGTGDLDDGLGTEPAPGVAPGVEAAPGGDLETGAGADGDAIPMTDVEPGDLEGATVYGNDGEEIGTVSEVETFGEGESISGLIVTVDERDVRLDAMSFAIHEGEDDDYEVHVTLEQEAFDALPEHQQEI